MTLRKWIYRLYLQSPGWRKTKELRKRGKCHKCKETRRLELHHMGYDWHNRHKILRWFIPNMFDPMRTLCAEHHRLEHGR